MNENYKTYSTLHYIQYLMKDQNAVDFCKVAGVMPGYFHVVSKGFLCV